MEKNRVLLKEDGINWIWYTEVEITGKEVKLGTSWRRHKYENRGEKPRKNDIIIPGRIAYKDVNIQLWKNDGMPGMIFGLKALYRMPPCIYIAGIKYKIIS